MGCVGTASSFQHWPQRGAAAQGRAGHPAAGLERSEWDRGLAVEETSLLPWGLKFFRWDQRGSPPEKAGAQCACLPAPVITSCSSAGAACAELGFPPCCYAQLEHARVETRCTFPRLQLIPSSLLSTPQSACEQKGQGPFLRSCLCDITAGCVRACVRV